MLLLAGMSKGVFWLGYFIGHLILILITAVVVFPILRAFGFPGISSNSLLGYFFSLFCFAVANIFTGYLFGMFVKSIETAQNAVGEFYNTSVMVPWLIVTFGLKNPNKTLEMILSIIPGFGLYRCFAIMESASLNDEPFTSADVFKWDNDDKEILPTCLVMLGTGLVALLCILSIDYGLLDVIKLKFGCMRSADATVDSMDGIVAKDEEGLPKAISGEVEGGGYIHADTVAKSFQRKGEQPLRAVKGVSLDVKSGDLVGLLGPNGAGKTTFIHCLTGMQMVSMDKGDAYIGGKSVRTEMEQAREYMGICPQFDAISEYLTGREHLHLLARIRGIPSNLIKEVADAYILALDLGEKANAHAGTYSGGNKRKLSVAMSMIGRTTATFLDEPSTGMDPGTRRFMWNFLEKSREDKAILLTTHSMEEADALCNRIAIMTKGAIRAAGTPQELKENYGEGFLITVRRGGRVPATSEESDKGSEEGEEEQPKTIQELIHLISADARTSSDEFAVMKFVVPKEGVELASIFELMEKHRERLGVLDFSVSQTTLEDIFLHFAE